ncbi:PREDICTED: uncharacterized protein LOC104807925 [Tarenaya hassleriana]|uniref:uncharacterized protein LOC104807925 n=1 Tax=Tarenaya hassleriana TaxID=28532 RepID=UPI00053C66DD|nr:PREDICTED: uncharacterized protein LOC104807925 [Tarenaya hassleriana]XP_010531679.1 PREDICTED: uncharacterized protein LOC104807925 [Tarenaya hassleriana]
MNKLLEFGRKAMFYVRVLSGYEERRIRNYRLQLEKRLQMAQQKKDEINRLPEQLILSEVRRMVEEMQNLNKQLEETEANIEEYFKPIDVQAESIMEIQLQGEKKTVEQMLAATQDHTFKKIEEAEKRAMARINANAKANTNTGESNPESESSASK